jgi:hypothetical protein
LVSKSEGLLISVTTTGGKPMTFGLQTTPEHHASAAPSDHSDRSELAGLIAAGVMTFLLSGDLRLATRATRLLIADDRSSPIDAQRRTPSRHRVRHRRR